MPFIGNQPALSYTSFAKQDFTTSATTSYTLDHPVTNENEIALFINFVRQEPTTAYTASGTSLTLTSATSASDDMYCVFLGKAVQTVNPPNGSVGLSQLSATGTKDSTTFLRGDNTFAVAGGDNTPAFMAYLSANQTISVNTEVKINLDTEVFDSDNGFNTSTYKYVVPSAGRYYLSLTSTTQNTGTSAANMQENFIFINGSKVTKGRHSHQNNNGYAIQVNTNAILNLSVNDEIEAYVIAEQSSGSTFVRGDAFYQTNLIGYKLIGA